VEEKRREEKRKRDGEERKKETNPDGRDWPEGIRFRGRVDAPHVAAAEAPVHAAQVDGWALSKQVPRRGVAELIRREVESLAEERVDAVRGGNVVDARVERVEVDVEAVSLGVFEALLHVHYVGALKTRLVSRVVEPWLVERVVPRREQVAVSREAVQEDGDFDALSW